MSGFSGILNRLSPIRFFVICALILEIVYTIVTPPLQAPDEFNHFFRVYQISEGQFLPVKEDQRLGGYLPAGLMHFSEQYLSSAQNGHYATTYDNILLSFDTPLHPEKRRFVDFPNTAYYSPVSYLPQAFAVFVLRQLGAGPAVMYCGARLFTFLIWMLAMVVVLRLLPGYHWMFVLILLLPMQIFISNSLSADTVTNILSFLFIALILRSVADPGKLSNKRLLLLALIPLVLILAKVIYAGLILLLLIIPWSKFGSKRNYIFYLSCVLIYAVLVFINWSQTIMAYYLSRADYNSALPDVMGLSLCGNYQQQKELILNHPFYFPEVIFNSLFRHPSTYLESYIGYLGNSDLFLPRWLYVTGYVVIFFAAIAGRSQFRLNRFQGLIVFVAAFASFVLLLLSQHLLWDCPGEGIVDLVQGRYLIPLMPLLFILIGGIGFFQQMNAALPVVIFIVVIQLVAGSEIYRRYFIGTDCIMTEVHCDPEPVTGTVFTSSQPGFVFEGASQLYSKEGHSGTSSVRLTPESPYGLACELPNPHDGDLIEVEAWQKGEGGVFVFSGGGGGCQEFYSANALPSTEEKSGWTRIKCVYMITSVCKDLKTKFYVWNRGRGVTLIDDLKLVYKRRK